MLGYYAQYSKEYITTLMLLTTLFFALPIFIAPLAWARAMRWAIPEQQHLTIYFGRCLGAVYFGGRSNNVAFRNHGHKLQLFVRCPFRSVFPDVCNPCLWSHKAYSAYY